MNKTIRFTHENKDYTLEFTRKTIAIMERKGFVASEITDKPMTTLPALFAGAFLANHKFTKPEVIDAIFDKLTKKDELIGVLVDMYNEPILTLVDEPEVSEGNVEWTAD